MIAKKRSDDLTISGILILCGILLFVFNVLLYPLTLPKTINGENSQWIQLSVYIFYTLFTMSIISVIIGIYKIIRTMAYRNDDSIIENNSKVIQSTPFFLPSPVQSVQSDSSSSKPKNDNNKKNSVSIWKIFFAMMTDKRLSIFFLLVTFAYGFFYAIVSSTIIIRLDGGGLSHMYGIEEFPFIIMMQYGPSGYTPAISIYLNDNLGIFILPITLTIAIIISALVGFNAVSSIYAFKLYRLMNKKKDIGEKNKTKFISIVGTTTGLFTACPTCASLYLFSAFSGSLSTTIASFALSYYALFLLLSIPLLVASPFIIAANIKKMGMDTNSNNQCKVSKKK